jgi:hypothetical protein
MEVVKTERWADDDSTTRQAIIRTVEPSKGRALLIAEPYRTSSLHGAFAGQIRSLSSFSGCMTGTARSA